MHRSNSRSAMHAPAAMSSYAAAARSCVRVAPLLFLLASTLLVLYTLDLWRRTGSAATVPTSDPVLLMRSRDADEALCKSLVHASASSARCPSQRPCQQPPDAPVAAALQRRSDAAAALTRDATADEQCLITSGGDALDDAAADADGAAVILVVFGTRPEAIKLAPVVHFLKRASVAKEWTQQRVRVLSVATGQHASILDSAMQALGLVPDVVMSLMSAQQDMTSLTAKVLYATGCVFRRVQPSLVVVQGDTITAAAAGLAAFLQGIPLAHVEAGLRTFLPRDPYPEEVLRTGISSYATLHFAPTQYAADALLASGVCASKLFVVGNPVVDSLLSILRAGPSSDTVQLLEQYRMPHRRSADVVAQITGDADADAADRLARDEVLRGERPLWLIVTMHRRENFGAPVRHMVAAVRQLIENVPNLRVLLPVHPNPNVRDVITAELKAFDRILIVEPMPYDAFVFALAAADAVLTDSGGLQEESVALGKRLFIMRQTSERPEALLSGRATLVGTSTHAILHFVGTWAASLTATRRGWAPPAPPTIGGVAPGHVSSQVRSAQRLEAAPLGRQGEELYPVSQQLARRAGSADSASLSRPAARLVFGDGLAAARIARASLRFIARFRPALGGAAASAAARQSGADAATAAAMLRSFMSCEHNTNSGDALVTAPASSDHTLHDFVWHGGPAHFLAAHERLRLRAECSAQPAPHAQGVPERSFDEIAQLPSFYRPKARKYDAAAFGVTVIVSVFRRPQTFIRLLSAIRNQTHVPIEVWVTTFGSKHEAEFRTMIRAYDADARMFKFVAGDPNFKYFGRFALASMAKTPYVALLDDDCIPGPRMLAALLHMINVKNGDYNGLLGMKGHGNVAETATDAPSGQHTLAPYWVHWVYRGDTAIPVDLTGGVWFLRTEWVHHMWRELPVPIEPGAWGPWQTGEDFQLTYSLRKFLGLSTYLFPQPRDRPDVWGQSADYLDISRAGDTTDISDILARRQKILYGLLLKGYVPARADTLWGEAWNRTNVAVFVDSFASATSLSHVVRFLRTHYSDVIRVHVVIALPPVSAEPSTSESGADGAAPPPAAFAHYMHPRALADASDSVTAVLQALGVAQSVGDYTIGVWDLQLSKLGAHARWRATDLAVETEVATAGVLEALRPAAVVLPVAELQQSPVALGAANAAAALRVPSFGLEGTRGAQAAGVAGAARGDSDAAAAQDSACADMITSVASSDTGAGHARLRRGSSADAAPAAATAAAAALCAPLHAYSRSTAVMNVVTNSEALLVQRLFDTLCACERASSARGGAFSRCPELQARVLLTDFRSLAAYGG